MKTKRLWLTDARVRSAARRTARSDRRHRGCDAAVLEALERRWAMTANVPTGVDSAGMLASDMSLEGPSNEVSQKWFWTLPAAAPTVAGAITVQPVTTVAPVSSSDWVVRLTSQAISEVKTLADVRSVIMSAGSGIDLVAGLGQPGLMLVRSSLSAMATTTLFRSHGGIASFERNNSLRIASSTALPNDPDLQRLYGLNNVGQTGGAVDADIDAPEAWSVTTGSRSTVVGVIDTGIDLVHRDLYRNIWINQKEIPATLRTQLIDVDVDGRITFVDLNNVANAAFVSDGNKSGYIDAVDILADQRWADGMDTDSNGFTDDFCGWDFVNNDNNPSDDHFHGTHVAGTIGASGNDGTGITGVSWNVSMMGLKFLSSAGWGTTAAAIRAINYATMIRTSNDPGLRVTNNSWGGGAYSQPLKDAIDAGGNAGVLFVAAAGNGARDSDLTPSYPAAYPSAAIVSVASLDHRDGKAGSSNWGATSVDLGAPGVSIWSTMPGGRYNWLSGTSMASPHVAGAAALALSQRPMLSVSQLKDALLTTTDAVASLAGRSVTGGRLNAAGLVQSLIVSPTAIEISSRSIAENAWAGTAVGDLRVSGDGAEAAYSFALVSGIGDSDNTSFTIDGITLRTARPLDFEGRSYPSVRIRATTAVGESVERILSLRVANVNEAPTAVVYTPVRSPVPENTLPGTVIGRFGTIDQDAGDSFAYILVSGEGDGDNGAFRIQGNQLLTTGALDFESQPLLSLRVRSTDRGGLSRELVLSVRVGDVNEPPTRVRLDGALASLPENTDTSARIAVGTIRIEDDKLGTNVVTLAGPDAGSFEVDRGILYLKAGVSLDYERQQSLLVRVHVADPALRSSSPVSVEHTLAVTDVAEPLLIVRLREAAVAENSPIGTAVGGLVLAAAEDAIPLATPAGNGVRFELVVGEGDEGNSRFTITGQTLVTATPLDHEEAATHSLRIRATDAAGRVIESVVFVDVTDLDEAPADLLLSGTTVRENMPTGSLIGLLQASDPDGHEVTFRLVSGDGAANNGDFQIVGDRLITSRPLDHEGGATRSIRVRVTDPSGQGVERVFTISVVDVNEAPHDVHLSNDLLRENLPVGAVIGSFITADVDRGSRHVYRFVSGFGATDNAAFRIIGNQLRAARSFDFESKSIYSIRVRSIDQGGLSVERVFTIRVTDVAEQAGVVRLSRLSGEGYARLVQGGISLQQGQTYRFTMRMAGDVRLQSTDHIPEFWGQGQIFDGQVKRAEFRDGWTTLEATVTTPVTGVFELKLALWSLQELRVTAISLRSAESGVELVRNGGFIEGLNGWYTHGGSASLVAST